MRATDNLDTTQHDPRGDKETSVNSVLAYISDDTRMDTMTLPHVSSLENEAQTAVALGLSADDS